MKGDLTLLSAVDAAEHIRAGRLSSEALVTACLARIDATDDTIKAWAHLDGETALAQAREMDRIRKAGHAVGPLHGVPVGLKDIIDTCDMPTARGSVIFDGRQTDTDATIVERLREAGAVVLGKTKTTELAFVHATDTTNPADVSRTPGGSSSGSAAAVAAHHVPLAIGTQTNGSVIRPASFCGVFGFKPTRGVISRTGLLQTSVSLDQVGGFARSIDDVALLCDVIGSYDQRDPLSFARPRPGNLDGARADVPALPDIAWFDLPINSRLDADARAGLDAVMDALGARVERFDTAPQLAGLVEVQAIIHEYEICQHLAEVFDTQWDQISTTLQAVITRGRTLTKDQYEDAIAVKNSANAFFTDHFNDFDAIIAPSATGQAPLISAGGTGDPIFCTIWTLAGLPSLSLPLLVGENDLPVGVQLIGAAEEDDRLLRTASWVQNALSAQT
ncbi:MAG: Asp-tRNA(Asn)/Glu-tRNA(Gln) amidotransferase A subunit family amidase [Paracoccaceae bacterium]|jgi:Asp-tRNA(Asn)/Glu-tRNA(Gln) amidotransferase A subunit family amidase